jgi:hypothetical protein
LNKYAFFFSWFEISSLFYTILIMIIIKIHMLFKSNF